jgi:23S rRNA pseudouridine1911/1915/1917 synthase
LVAAKTEPAHAAISAAFARHDIERAYLALVWGRPAEARGRIEGAIGRDARNRKKMAVVARGGKAAVTHYRLRRQFGQAASLLECRLETGRTHQIRVHLAHSGHPVIGDPLYARARRGRLAALPPDLASRIRDLHRQALHAHILGFQHPRSGEPLRFQSELPQDLKVLVDSLEELQLPNA